MPLAQIDSKGTSIYYNDSGVPHGSSQYTTIVLVHGAVVNSGMYAFKLVKSNSQLLTHGAYSYI